VRAPSQILYELDDQLHETWREVATQSRRLANNDEVNYTASLDCRSRMNAIWGRRELRVALAELQFWDEIGRLPPRRVPLPLAMGRDGAAGSVP
jgi:hypothetical protein